MGMVRQVGELNALLSPPIRVGFGAEQAERHDEMAHGTEKVCDVFWRGPVRRPPCQWQTGTQW